MLVIGLVIVSYQYWTSQKNLVQTDDAYVNANIVQIAPRVSGQVINVHVLNNQYVTKNMALFSLDAIPFTLTANEAKAKLVKDEALVNIAQLTAERTLNLVKKRVASEQSGDKAQSELRSAKAELDLAKYNYQRQELNVKYSKVLAPTSGWVTNLSLREGSIVEIHRPVFALISDNEFWVDANFKETEVSHIFPGQKAKIRVDMYPKHVFTGVVESISGGTGAVFSLLPPQNATGNWVKVTQRIPVKIRVLNPASEYPLRIGTSASVTIIKG